MAKRHVLKASFTDYIHYYKKLKLGLQKACFFLRDLELELEKYAQNQTTKHSYYNPDTKKELFFLDKDVFEIRKKIEDLTLEYHIMKPELLKLEEYDSFHDFILKSMHCFDISMFDKINFILSFRSEDEDKKLDILARIFILFEPMPSCTYDQVLKIFGYHIIDFCITKCKLSEESKKIICDRLDVSSLDQLINKENLHKEIARPLIEHLLLMDPDNFFYENDKISKKFNKLDFEIFDLHRYYKLPEVFSLKKSNNYYIDKEKLFFFLQDLDDYRIRLNVKKLNSRILNISYLDKFEQLCIRFRSPEMYHKMKGYFCNFLSKRLLPIQELKLEQNDRFNLYFWEIYDFIRNIHLARLNLHNQIFSYYVISCFSSYEYNDDSDIFFSIKRGWGHKILKKRVRKKQLVEFVNDVNL